MMKSTTRKLNDNIIVVTVAEGKIVKARTGVGRVVLQVKKTRMIRGW